MKLPKIYNTYFVALIATLGGMLFGFDISSMSAIIESEQYRTFFNEPAGIRQGAIGSALAAGSVVGSAVAGPISDWMGRRNSIGFACIFWLAGTAMQAAVTGFGTLVAGRVLNGITVGITSSQVPVYLAEIARREKRGSLIIIQQFAIGKLWMKDFLLRAWLIRCGRMGHPDNVLHRLRLYIHRRSGFLPHSVGDSIRTLFLPHSRYTLPARVTKVACKEGPTSGGDSHPRLHPSTRRPERPACGCRMGRHHDHSGGRTPSGARLEEVRAQWHVEENVGRLHRADVAAKQRSERKSTTTCDHMFAIG